MFSNHVSESNVQSRTADKGAILNAFLKVVPTTGAGWGQLVQGNAVDRLREALHK